MDSRGSPLAGVLEEAGPGRAAARGAPRSRRWLISGAWVAGAALAFGAYLRLAGTRAVNSDGASLALQAWDMLHGNPLLRGWTTTDVSFYTTELPQYMLVELVRGFGADVVHVAAAMTYTLAVLFSALLAKGTAAGREAAVRVGLAAGIMLAPQLGSGVNVLVSSPDHIGTSVPLMAVWLVLDRARPRWYVPVITSLLLGWALVADRLVLVAGVLPLVLVCGFRVARAVLAGRRRGVRRLLAGQRFDIALAAGAVAAVALAGQVPRLIHAAGGYTAAPLDMQADPFGAIVGHNLPIAGESLLMLPGADFLGLPATPATFFVVLHLAGVTLAGCGIALAARRFRDDGDRVSQVLLVAIAVNVAAFAVSSRVDWLPSAREIAPVLPFAAALAGRQLARPLVTARLGRRALLPLLAVVLAGYLAGLGLEVSQPQAPPQASRLTSWLAARHLGASLSGYWEANIVTLTSGGRAEVRLVGTSGRFLSRGGREVNAAWYDPARSSAHVVVLFPGIDGYPGFTGRAQAIATFGRPDATYHVGRYTVLYWRRNLLTRLR